MNKSIKSSLFISGLSTILLVSNSLAAESDTSRFERVWSGMLTATDNEYWNVEDYTCFAGCPIAAYELLVSLLDDPANDERPLNELTREATAFMRQHLAERSTPAGLEMQRVNNPSNDPTLLCQDYGYVREAINPLPVDIIRDGDTLVFDYEEWNLERTIYMDGRDFPANLQHTLLGYSIGHMENETLVIETAGVSPDIYYSFQSGGGYSDQLTGVERYTISGSPAVLTVELTVQDPVTLTAPFVLTKTWVATPDVEILTDMCGDVPGQR